MLNVIICEDNHKQREQVEKIIVNAIESNSLDIEVKLSTDNPYKVIEYAENSKEHTGIYFLDITLNTDMNGLTLAKNIRSKDPNGYIIFITTHTELTLMTFEYKIEALDYIIKDDVMKIKNRVIDCLLQAYERYNNRKDHNNIISINSGNRTISIEFDDILFFETSDKVHKVKLHTSTRQIEFYGTLREVERMVDDRFYRSHKSYLVNVLNIEEIDKENMVAIMKNEEKCYISSRYLKGLLKKW